MRGPLLGLAVTLFTSFALWVLIILAFRRIFHV